MTLIRLIGGKKRYFHSGLRFPSRDIYLVPLVLFQHFRGRPRGWGRAGEATQLIVTNSFYLT